MKPNFKSLNSRTSNSELQKHWDWLTTNPLFADTCNHGRIDLHGVPDGYENFHTVDVLGKELIWMNNTFPKENFTWYLWFESVFLVPEEMLPFLLLRWS